MKRKTCVAFQVFIKLLTFRDFGSTATHERHAVSFLHQLASNSTRHIAGLFQKGSSSEGASRPPRAAYWTCVGWQVTIDQVTIAPSSVGKKLLQRSKLGGVRCHGRFLVASTAFLFSANKHRSRNLCLYSQQVTKPRGVMPFTFSWPQKSNCALFPPIPPLPPMPCKHGDVQPRVPASSPTSLVRISRVPVAPLS